MKESERPCLLIIQCDSGHINRDLIACARYRIYDKRANALLNRSKSHHVTHVVFIVHLPVQVFQSTFVGFQGDPWVSCHIDELRPSDTNAITLELAQGTRISRLFYGALEEPGLDRQTSELSSNMEGVVFERVISTEERVEEAIEEGEREGEAMENGERDGEAEAEAIEEREREGEAMEKGEREAMENGEREGEEIEEGEAEAEAIEEREREGEAMEKGEREAMENGEREGEEIEEGEAEAEAIEEREREGEAMEKGEREAIEEGEREAVEEGEGEREAIEEGEGEAMEDEEGGEAMEEGVGEIELGGQGEEMEIVDIEDEGGSSEGHGSQPDSTEEPEEAVESSEGHGSQPDSTEEAVESSESRDSQPDSTEEPEEAVESSESRGSQPDSTEEPEESSQSVEREDSSQPPHGDTQSMSGTGAAPLGTRPFSDVHTQCVRLNSCIQAAASRLQDSSQNNQRVAERVRLLIQVIPRKPTFPLGKLLLLLCRLFSFPVHRTQHILCCSCGPHPPYAV